MPTPDVVQAMKTRYRAEEFSLGVILPGEVLLEAMRTLREAYGYRYYVLASATEHPGAFDVIHGVRNLDTRDTLFVKVVLPKETPEVDTLAFLYKGADWHEREVYDLFGIGFRSHPDLRRILMPEEYEGHPLRKDFPMDTPWGYRPATRREEA